MFGIEPENGYNMFMYNLRYRVQENPMILHCLKLYLLILFTICSWGW